MRQFWGHLGAGLSRVGSLPRRSVARAQPRPASAPAGEWEPAAPAAEARRSRAAWFLVLIVACGFAWRLYHLDAPLTDYRAMRQAHTAAIARSCYRSGFDPLAARPDAIGFPRANFPLFPWLVSLVYGMVGGVHEWAGRLLAALFSTATIYLVYRAASDYWDRSAGLWAAVFFAIAPASVFFGRAFMPEALVLFLMTGCFYAMSRWNAAGGWARLALGAACLGLAVTVKLTPIMLAVPVAWLLYERGRARALLGVQGWVVAAAALLPVILWYIPYVEHVLDTRSRDWRPGLSTLHFYVQMVVNRPGGILLGPAAYLLALVAFFSRPGSRRAWAVHLWAVAGCLYILAAPKRNFALEYYNLPLLPAGCMLAGRGMTRVLRGDFPLRERLRAVPGWLWGAAGVGYLATVVLGYVAQWRWELTYRMPGTAELLRCAAIVSAGALPLGVALYHLWRRAVARWPRMATRALGSGAVALTLAASVGYLALMYRQRSDLLAAARRLAAVSAPGDKVIEATDKSFVILYYADRRGWYRFRRHFRPAQVEELRRRGAQWFATTLLDEFEADEELRDYLSSRYPLAGDSPVVKIFDLRTESEADPRT